MTKELDYYKKMKVKFYDKSVWKSVWNAVGVISTISCFSIFIKDVYAFRFYIFGAVATILVCVFIYKWIKANMLKHVSLSINNSTVEIEVGDIFEQKGLKVIAFNEYFDTKVDEKVISSNTLHGKFLNQLNEEDRKKLKNIITKDRDLQGKIVNSLSKSKHTYKLGSILKYNDYLLMAFSHFDTENRAYLTLPDYISCLLEMWNEIDKCYNGETVVLPLLGSGITRLKEAGDFSNQELLEVLLWSFKLSRVKFNYPSKIKIIIYPDNMDKINLYKIKNNIN